MAEQSAASHSKYVPGYHFILPVAILALMVGSGINVVDACKKEDGFNSAALICLISVILLLLWWYTRRFAIKAQDRAIRAEENLRHFAMTGKLLDSRLRMGQIIALRFASDEEFVELVKRAADEQMAPKAIKMAIKNWRADNNRA